MFLATCPSPADLERLFLGGLPEQEVEALEEHVLGCGSCLETLRQLLHSKETLASLPGIANLRLAFPAGKETQTDPPGSHCVVDDLVKKLESLRPLSASSPQTQTVSQDDTANPQAQPPPCRPDDADRTQTPDTGHESSVTNFLTPPQADDELGRLGKYRVLEILGHGGMGVVFKAEDPLLRRTVAVKVMLPALAASASAGQRFLREAQAMAAIEHDHIVRIYQVEEERGVPFLAMELLKGEPLADRLNREPKLPLAEVLRIGREIAEGLGAAHATGLIHRDIKPGNIWLEAPRDRVKILDFGLARAGAQPPGLSQPGAIVGTPEFMAPEQGRGGPVDARSDLFSLGVVLYRLATGQQPFHGPDTVSTLLSVATHEPAPPLAIDPDLPPELSGLVMKLLEKDPTRRVASADTVVQALQILEEKLAGLPGNANLRLAFSTALVKAGSAPPRSRRRRPQLIAAMLLVGALVVGGLVGTWATGLIRISSDQVDYVIDTDDPDFSFSVRKGGVALQDRKTNRTYNLTVVRHHQAKGEFELAVTDPDGLQIKMETFTIKRGEKVALRAWFERKQQTAVKPTPVDDAWLKAVAALPAQKQAEAVAAKLKERNPGFDGKVTPTIDHGVVTELTFVTDEVTDIASVRALTRLRALSCTGSAPGRGQLADLSPLKGMNLTSLTCNFTLVSDLSPLKDVPLTRLEFVDTQVADLSPLKDMRLAYLNCGATKVTDLSPLKDMKLTRLLCSSSNVTDLSPLKGMRLAYLNCGHTEVSDLSPLEGMPLTQLEIFATRVSDLSPLKDMKLTTLLCYTTKVTDLSPLRGLPLMYLDCGDTQVSDLSPLKDMKLTQLQCNGTKVTDLAPVRKMPLKVLICDFEPERDAEILRSIKTLQKINNMPALEFWKEVDKKKPDRKP
jgi:serine/threonine protein kinase